MCDTEVERNSNSKTNLIGFQHVGVTAQFHSPLTNLMQTNNSPTETDSSQGLYGDRKRSNTKYNKFKDDHSNVDTNCSPTDSSKVLYEMKPLKTDNSLLKSQKLTPSKIQFHLYRPSRQAPRIRHQFRTKNMKANRKLFRSGMDHREANADTPLLKRFSRLLANLRKQSKLEISSAGKLINDSPKPQFSTSNTRQMRIGIYPFDYGHPEYLQTNEIPPQAISLIIADRTVMFATQFWSEVFGSIHIGVAFVTTFILQTYRFFLYSLINTLLFGFLNITSDYLVKPLLTVVFNGFIQPPLTFCFNVLSSLRDVFQPIADSLNNFIKPFATVVGSFRLINTTYNKRKFRTSV